MGYQKIEVRKLTPNIGAEIREVDLSKTLGNLEYEEIHQALTENLVIFFRDQTISVDQQKDFGRRFGKLHIHPAAPKGLEQHPEILVIKADENSKRVAGEEWHSDVSCDPEPPMGSLLYLTTVPPDGGGDTMFANMYRAYETLSEPVRKMLEGLTAIHDGEHVYRGRYGMNDEGKVFPRSEHPVIRTHPVTGKKLLFVNRGFTTRIVQLKRDESAAVLEMLSSRHRSCIAASSGSQTRSRSGTTAVSSTTPCGTIIRPSAMDIA
jgi:taurine dioxygenase